MRVMQEDFNCEALFIEWCNDRERSDELDTLIGEKPLRYYPEMDLVSIHKGPVTATVTGYDWEYMTDGHTTGGTLTLLHHRTIGPLFAAGMCRYVLKEPHNMQYDLRGSEEGLALRIEAQVDGTLYSSVYDDQVKIQWSEDCIVAEGVLKDCYHVACQTEELSYRIEYQFNEESFGVLAEFSKGILICPVISRCDEKVYGEGISEDFSFDENTSQMKEKHVLFIQKDRTVGLEITGNLRLPYGTERIFSLVPGLQALRIDIQPILNKVEINLTYGAH